ncbi:dolichyl pyrophosphate Man9GlcNAc2 alpha-1,3-glucosyltransferase-like [Tubulanus polymorphus]|uniref:dolichyl pyrophosphate Man9GlcNAc2 alpha-1,3-glucosyltransferase-like n=1 Tax=Tubulanus polymorphus TaxID=672921 RepID=UPI003DA235D2
MDSMKLTGCILIAVIVRWAVSLFPYSGHDKKPMYGDFEAQRHWMEITYHLPAKEWYHNTSENNLQYWGLDYPPLTAYHSYLMGAIAHRINPLFVPLNASEYHHQIRIADSFHETHKIFMRYTVLIVDILIYLPAIIMYHFAFDKTGNIDSIDRCMNIVISMLYPGLVLVDHGHFQYNCVSLGLALWAIILIGQQWNLMASVFFCLALNYKQMELYHALPFFSYLLGNCFKQPTTNKALKSFNLLAFSVIVTFVICWFPFLKDCDISQPLQVIHRLFPLKRGIFEDKVSNVWCSLTVLPRPFKKIKDLPVSVMSAVSLITTCLCVLPSSLHLFRKPTFRNFKLSLVNVALVFYLFSYQVHEKSILLVALPVCLLLPEQPLMCMWLLLISTFSMYPLLMRDLLSLPCLAMQVLFIILVFLRYGSKLWNIASPSYFDKLYIEDFFVPSVSVAFLLCLLCQFKTPPTLWPDLWPVLISLYSCGHFLMFCFYFNCLQYIYDERDDTKKRN